MKIDGENIEILSSKNQLSLFGYESYFNSFVKLYKKNELPNVILLNGPKGLGKATFAYHFINYILSNIFNPVLTPTAEASCPIDT